MPLTRREDGSVHADPEGQRDNHHGGKSGILDQSAKREAQILDACSSRRRSARLAALSPVNLRHAAQFAQRRVAGFFWRHTLRKVLVNQILQMKL